MATVYYMRQRTGHLYKLAVYMYKPLTYVLTEVIKHNVYVQPECHQTKLRNILNWLTMRIIVYAQMRNS